MTDGENTGTCDYCGKAPRLLKLDDYNELACLDCLKRHGRVKPVEGEDLSKFRRPDNG